MRRARLRSGRHILRLVLAFHAERQHDEEAEPPDHEEDRDRREEPHQPASSSSISVPEKSFGLRKTTGLPCAPIFGSPSPSTRAPSRSSRSRAARDVGHLVAEVVHAAVRVALQEGGDRRGVAKRLQQLDAGVRQIDEDDADAVLRQRLRRGDLRAERSAIEARRRVKVRNRDRDMVQPAEHRVPQGWTHR